MKSVLIIEDYESIKNLYVAAFSKAGYAVNTAQSGAEGLEKTATTEYDIIVLDVLMLQLSGVEFLEKFDTAKHPKTLVVAVSNLDSPDVIQRAKSLGAAEYFVKSKYTPNELVAAIEAIAAA